MTHASTWWKPEEFQRKRMFLEKRALIIRSIRQYLEQESFVEVQTPILQICPVMDAHIHGFKTELLNVDLTYAQDMYLHTSPEFDMKKLLSAGMEKIFQICPVFRNAEGSALHSPEFTILEWYRSGTTYIQLMDDCVHLLQHVCNALTITQFQYKSSMCDPFVDWNRVSVLDAFKEYTDITLEDYLEDTTSFAKAANNLNIRTVETDKWEDIFHAIMAEKIEPYLGQGAPTILYDYPVSMASLARRKKSDPRLAERFELYICGVELANAFSELTDPIEQRQRFDIEMAVKQELYGMAYPADEEFFNALDIMPDSAGIALGIDRLIMLASGADNINDVLWAPVQRL